MDFNKALDKIAEHFDNGSLTEKQYLIEITKVCSAIQSREQWKQFIGKKPDKLHIDISPKL